MEQFNAGKIELDPTTGQACVEALLTERRTNLVVSWSMAHIQHFFSLEHEIAIVSASLARRVFPGPLKKDAYGDISFSWEIRTTVALVLEMLAMNPRVQAYKDHILKLVRTDFPIAWTKDPIQNIHDIRLDVLDPNMNTFSDFAGYVAINLMTMQELTTKDRYDYWDGKIPQSMYTFLTERTFVWCVVKTSIPVERSVLEGILNRDDAGDKLIEVLEMSEEEIITRGLDYIYLRYLLDMLMIEMANQIYRKQGSNFTEEQLIQQYKAETVKFLIESIRERMVEKEMVIVISCPKTKT